MFVVLFEVQPKPEQRERYLQLAAMLRPELLEMRGFIDNERYASRRSDAAAAWIERQPDDARHRHIRVIRDYGMHSREEAPQYYSGARRDPLTIGG